MLSTTRKNTPKKLFMEHGGKQKTRPEFFPAAQEKPANSMRLGKMTRKMMRLFSRSPRVRGGIIFIAIAWTNGSVHKAARASLADTNRAPRSGS
jgi:hypothetical protein